MYDRIQCEYCGKFISWKDIDEHQKGNNEKINSKMIYIMYPTPEPWGDVYWHMDCKQKETQEGK